MEFIDEAADDPWCLHLSYIKPHWPYIAPAPYHQMYSANQILSVNKSAAERDNPHPVHGAFMEHEDSQTFARDVVRQAVIPAYMGLIREIDDWMATLFAFLEERGLMDNTMIVFTSDHGDYLGDHWLGEKELLHEESVRVPLIIYDPNPRADATRGQINEHLTESIDLAATFLDAYGGVDDGQRLEGRSLLPLIRDGGETTEWRDYVISETDFAMRDAAKRLGLKPSEARGYMIASKDWKYILWEKHPSQLFDLRTDRQEQHDKAGQGLAAEQELHDALFQHFRSRRTRTTISDKALAARSGKAVQLKRGFRIGEW
ncbi:MAG: sulfatase-like hydrolase/transferase, partial [Alphaproteobacteria bacterium]